MMMNKYYILRDVSISVYEQISPLEKVAEILHIDKTEIADLQLLKRSLDLRRKQEDIYYVYTFRIAFYTKAPYHKKLEPCRVQEDGAVKLSRPKRAFNPVIIGCGPAGLFAAHRFMQYGITPVIVERGQRIDQRKKDINAFLQMRQLNVESNVCFGEGGAGTFSDGKLTSRSKDRRQREIFEVLVQYGADPSILYEQRPHLGTDVMQRVIHNMTNDLMRQGAEICFGTKAKDIALHRCHVRAVICDDREIETDTVVFAGGHSARDFYQLLFEKQVALEAKNFAVGVRIEHLRQDIDKSTYQKHYGKVPLPAAEYILKYKDASGRGAYTFCNCPGGVVVACVTERDTVCVNGMSYSGRNAQNTNSAVVVTVTKEDFVDKSPLAGMVFQRQLEQRAFAAAGGDYTAPIMSVGAFLNHADTRGFLPVVPSYGAGTKEVNLHHLFSDEIAQTLKNALRDFGKKLHGFDSAKAMLTAVESRTSSPVRILRNENAESINTGGLYVAGEGSGYAGGIVSSAIDGLRVAENILAKNEKQR